MADTTGKGAPRRRRPKAEPAPTTPDPIEIAMETEAKDASPDSPARRVLLKQELLIGADLKLRGWQIASERAGYALKLLTGAAGLAVAAAVGAMIWSASRADGLVIEAFSVPAALAERGITGETLARQLMDDLAAISEVSQSAEQQRGLSGDWGQAISIQIPQTGVSLAQMNAWLRETLGHQSHVSGEVMAAPDGTLTLVARSGSHGLTPLTGQEAGMATLIQRTAEAVYAREQPRSMGLYLVRQQRHEEANAWYRGRTNQPAARDRASSYLGQAWYAHGTKGDLAFVPLARKSIAADPTFSNPGAQLAGFESGFGHIESAYQLLRRAGMLAARDTAYVPQWRREQTMRIGSQLAASVGDWREARARTRENLGKHFLGDGSTGNAGPSAAMAMTSAAMHDIRQAHADLAAYDAVTSSDLERYRMATMDARLSAEDWAGVVAAADAVLTDQELLPDKGVHRPIPRAQKALALAHLGRMAEAQGLIGATPLDCQPCVVGRGEIAAQAGQPALADHWFGEAVKMAPSLPMASTAWGRVLLDRGQTDRAIAQLEIANTRGPHFADPLSWWGEALLRKGETRAAIKKFREADKYAPRWGRNHLLWGDALAKLGKPDKAREQWRAAAGMDLSAANRARVIQLLAEAS
jgi:tetratricopeptide (TPR) repeat protein